MPGEDLPYLLICMVPDGKAFNSRKELVPYLRDRWVDLIKKNNKDLWALQREVYDWLQMENPFIERPQELADLILESPHYSVVLSDPVDIVEVENEILDMETVTSIYEGENFGSLLQLLHEYF